MLSKSILTDAELFAINPTVGIKFKAPILIGNTVYSPVENQLVTRTGNSMLINTQNPDTSQSSFPDTVIAETMRRIGSPETTVSFNALQMPQLRYWIMPRALGQVVQKLTWTSTEAVRLKSILVHLIGTDVIDTVFDPMHTPMDRISIEDFAGILIDHFPTNGICLRLSEIALIHQLSTTTKDADDFISELDTEYGNVFGPDVWYHAETNFKHIDSMPYLRLQTFYAELKSELDTLTYCAWNSAAVFDSELFTITQHDFTGYVITELKDGENFRVMVAAVPVGVPPKAEAKEVVDQINPAIYDLLKHGISDTDETAVLLETPDLRVTRVVIK